MAWNGSDSAGQPANGKANRPAGRATSMTSPHKAQGVKHGLAALLVIVVLGGAALWFFTRPAPKVAAPKEPKKPAAITAVKPAAVKSNKTGSIVASNTVASVNASAVDAPKTNAAPRKLKLWEKGIRVPKSKPAPPKRFKYDAEEDIAFFLETEPGETIFGEIPFDKRFIDDLKASFKEPVEIKPDDTDEMKELKKSIQEMKVDLEKRMKAGEDIGQLFRDSRHQLIELGNYRRDTINDLMSLAREEGASRDEFDKFVEAVNTTLERKGVKPFKPTTMTYRMLEHSAKKRNLQK